MAQHNTDALEFLLNHPKTAHVISDVNTETIERRSFSPKKIKIFSSKYTSLEDAPEYKFSRNKEAEKALPDITNNHVQRIVSGDDKTENDKKALKSLNK